MSKQESTHGDDKAEPHRGRADNFFTKPETFILVI